MCWRCLDGPGQLGVESGVFGAATCSYVQLEKRRSRVGRDEAHGLLLLQALLVGLGGEVIMGCGAKQREGVEKKMRQTPESTFHGCRYQSVPAMVLPSAKG